MLLPLNATDLRCHGIINDITIPRGLPAGPTAFLTSVTSARLACQTRAAGPRSGLFGPAPHAKRTPGAGVTAAPLSRSPRSWPCRPAPARGTPSRLDDDPQRRVLAVMFDWFNPRS